MTSWLDPGRSENRLAGGNARKNNFLIPAKLSLLGATPGTPTPKGRGRAGGWRRLACAPPGLQAKVFWRRRRRRRHCSCVCSAAAPPGNPSRALLSCGLWYLSAGDGLWVAAVPGHSSRATSCSDWGAARRRWRRLHSSAAAARAAPPTRSLPFPAPLRLPRALPATNDARSPAPRTPPLTSSARRGDGRPDTGPGTDPHRGLKGQGAAAGEAGGGAGRAGGRWGRGGRGGERQPQERRGVCSEGAGGERTEGAERRAPTGRGGPHGQFANCRGARGGGGRRRTGEDGEREQRTSGKSPPPLSPKGRA